MLWMYGFRNRFLATKWKPHFCLLLLKDDRRLMPEKHSFFFKGCELLSWPVRLYEHFIFHLLIQGDIDPSLIRIHTALWSSDTVCHVQLHRWVLVPAAFSGNSLRMPKLASPIIPPQPRALRLLFRWLSFFESLLTLPETINNFPQSPPA